MLLQEELRVIEELKAKRGKDTDESQQSDMQKLTPKVGCLLLTSKSCYKILWTVFQLEGAGEEEEDEEEEALKDILPTDLLDGEDLLEMDTLMAEEDDITKSGDNLDDIGGEYFLMYS
jgi:hypothetical protein